MNPSETITSFADAVELVSPAVVAVVARRARGSGVVWRPGVVVTNAAVVWRASSVSLVLPSGERVPGGLRGADGATDLAVITFQEGAAAPIATPAAAADTLRVGDPATAVGRDAAGLTHASFGHLGAVGGAWRTWRGGRVERLIRLDGGLYPGLAGAPVATAGGAVIGVASAMLSRHHGVVLPAETVDRIVDALLAHGRVPHGYLGIAAQPVRATVDEQPTEGLLVSALADDGPAARAGVRVGDVIVKVAGEPVSEIGMLRDRLVAGAGVALLVSRGGAGLELHADVTERPSRRCH